MAIETMNEETLNDERILRTNEFSVYELSRLTEEEIGVVKSRSK